MSRLEQPSRSRPAGTTSASSARIPYLALPALLVLLALPSSGVTNATSLAWPPPPAEVRIRYLKSISTPADFGARFSLWKRLAGLLSGNRPDRTQFRKPFGLSIDDQGVLCGTDTGTASVWHYNPATRRFLQWDSISATRLVSPVAAVACGEQLFIADSVLGRILVADLKGNLLFEITGVTRPSGLTLCDNTLFVADAGAHSIAAFDLHGKFLRRFGKQGAAPGEFNTPTHIASAPEQRLLVTDSLNERIQIFDTHGHNLGIIGQAGNAGGQFSRPKGVTSDSFGHIYVADAMHDNIQVFDGEGRFLLNWGESGSGPGEFWMPAGIARGRNNEIFVADSYNRRIQVFQYVGKE